MTRHNAHSFTKIAIFGAGLSGRAAYQRAKGLGIACVVDDDLIKAHDAITPSDFIAWQEWDFKAIDALILSPGIAHHHPTPHPVAIAAKAHHTEILSEVEFGLRTGEWGKLVVITGTNGKSTTTALTGHLLKEAGLPVVIGGNLGTPLCAFDGTDSTAITVLELSSYQLETTPSLAPYIAALLNITPDHLDRHGGLKGYIDAKRKSLGACGKDAIALIGNDSTIMRETLDWARQSLSARVEEISAANLEALVLDNPYLAGAHNAQNAAFAVSIARAFDVDEAAIQAGLASFVGLAHRLQPVGHHGGHYFVNDSKATNGDATAKALGAYQNIIWLAGGMAKADGLAACQDYFTSVRRAHFFGQCAQDFHDQAGAHFPCTMHETMDDAFHAAVSDLPDEAVILLSPAAASFDEFDNFGARGRHFETLAQAYIALQSDAEKEVCHAR